MYYVLSLGHLRLFTLVDYFSLDFTFGESFDASVESVTVQRRLVILFCRVHMGRMSPNFCKLDSLPKDS